MGTQVCCERGNQEKPERKQAQLAKRLGSASREDFLGNYRLAAKRIRKIYEQGMEGAAKP